MKSLFLKNKLPLFAFALVLFITACSTSGKQEKNDIKTGEIKGNTLDMAYDFKFPILEGGEIAKKITNSIEKQIKTEIIDFNKNAKIVCHSDFEGIEITNQLFGDYKIIENNEKIFSTRLRVFIDWSPTSIPTYYYICLNFRKKDGNLIRLDDMLEKRYKDKNKAYNILYEICKYNFRNEDDSLCFNIWKTKPKPEIYECANITKNGFLIIFDNYHLETKLCGNPEIFISYDGIEKLWH